MDSPTLEVPSGLYKQGAGHVHHLTGGSLPSWLSGICFSSGMYVHGILSQEHEVLSLA